MRATGTLITAAVTLITPFASLPAQSRPTVNAAFVVSTDWLADHRRDPNLVLIHVVDDSAYRKDHIPGSRSVWYRDFVMKRGLVSTELPSVEHLKAVMERLGISNRSHVVVYGVESPMATRFLFTLDYLGHDRMSFLDGGMTQWKAEGRAVTTEAVRPGVSSFMPRPREELVASADWITERTKRPGLALIDTRTDEEYLGTGGRSGMPSVGHLAGARQLQWEQLFRDSSATVLRSVAELQQLYSERVGDGKDVVTYCWVGYRGSATYFVARYLGYTTRLYDGSYQDWSQRNLPVRSGTAP